MDKIGDGSIYALWWLLRIFSAGVCGFFIGYERKTRSKEAGVRTHAIVAMGAALMMVISKYAFFDLPVDKFDGARVAAQVVSGIGFLGAGIIVYKRDIIHGITTAAGIWTTAGVGMAIGSGLYIIGIVSTILLISFQVLLHIPFKVLKGRVYSILKAQISFDNPKLLEDFKNAFNIKRFIKFKEYRSDDGFYADVEFSTSNLYTAEDLHNIITEHKYIKTLEKYEEI